MSVGFELIGLIVEPGSDMRSPAYLAAVYDPNADTVHLVRSGDTLGRLQIKAIDPTGVLVADGSDAYKLGMDEWRLSRGEVP